MAPAAAAGRAGRCGAGQGRGVGVGVRVRVGEWREHGASWGLRATPLGCDMTGQGGSDTSGLEKLTGQGGNHTPPPWDVR